MEKDEMDLAIIFLESRSPGSIPGLELHRIKNHRNRSSEISEE
jgi:hypothetical protein